MDTTFPNGNVLVFDAWLLQLIYSLVTILENRLNFLQRNRLPPSLVFVAIVALVSARFCELLGLSAAVFPKYSCLPLKDIVFEFLEVLRRILQRWLDQSNTIRDLQRELDTYYHPLYVQQLRGNKSTLEKQLDAVKGEYLESHRALKNSQNHCSLKEQHIRRLELDIEELKHGQSPAAARATERELRSKLEEARHRIADIEEEMVDVEEQSDIKDRKKLERQYKPELRKKQNMIDQHTDLIAKLRKSSTFEQPQHVVTIDHIISAATWQLTNAAPEHRQAITDFLALMLKRCGIDPQHYVAFFSGTEAVSETHGGSSLTPLSTQVLSDEDVTSDQFVQYTSHKSNTEQQASLSDSGAAVGTIERSGLRYSGFFDASEPPTSTESVPTSVSQLSPPDFTTFLPPPIDQPPTSTKPTPVLGSTPPLGTTAAFGITSDPNSNSPAEPASHSLPPPSAPASTTTSFEVTSLPAPPPMSTPTPGSSLGSSNASIARSTSTQVASDGLYRDFWWQRAVTNLCNQLAPGASAVAASRSSVEQRGGVSKRR